MLPLVSVLTTAPDQHGNNIPSSQASSFGLKTHRLHNNFSSYAVYAFTIIVVEFPFVVMTFGGMCAIMNPIR